MATTLLVTWVADTVPILRERMPRLLTSALFAAGFLAGTVSEGIAFVGRSLRKTIPAHRVLAIGSANAVGRSSCLGGGPIAAAALRYAGSGSQPSNRASHSN